MTLLLRVIGYGARARTQIWVGVVKKMCTNHDKTWLASSFRVIIIIIIINIIVEFKDVLCDRASAFGS
jgi:hypothetical protein